jgi:hypothetical protein
VIRTTVFFAIVALVLMPAGATRREAPIRVGGSPLALIAARGSLWVLTCDKGCSGEARRSVGRLVRIDPQRRRIIGSVAIEHPGGIAIAAGDIYATDFYRDTVRRTDPVTLRTTATLKLALPFRFSSRDNAFLPIDVAVRANDVGVALAFAGGRLWTATPDGAIRRLR